MSEDEERGEQGPRTARIARAAQDRRKISQESENISHQNSTGEK